MAEFVDRLLHWGTVALVGLIFGGTGFYLAASFAHKRGHFQEEVAAVAPEVALISDADCGIASDRGSDGVTVSLQCGMSQKGWEALVAGHLDGLDLEALRDGQPPSAEQMDAWTASLGTVEAVKALLASTRTEELQAEALSLRPPTEVLMRASLPLGGSSGVGEPLIWTARTPEQPDPVEPEVSLISHADCGVSAGRDIDGETIEIKCGLSQAGWEAIIARYLEGLDLDELRDGRKPSAELLEAWAAKMGTVEAVEALLAGLMRSEESGTSLPSVAPTEILISASLPATGGAQTNDSVLWTARTPTEPILVLPNTAPKTDQGAALMAGVRTKCGIAAGRDLRVEAAKVDCGASEQEVNDVISRLVAESGVTNLRDLLAQDATKRDQLIAKLAGLNGFDSAIAENLLKRLEVSDALGEDGGAVDAALREQVRQAVILLRMGEVADVLESQQAAVADAVAAGDFDAVEQVYAAAAPELRVLADDMSPEDLPGLVVAAELAEEARLAMATDGLGAYVGLIEAAEIAADTWPAISTSFELEAANTLVDDRWRAEFIEAAADPGFDPSLEAARQWLATSGQLRAQSLDLALSGANVLSLAGGSALDDEVLSEARGHLERLAPMIDLEEDELFIRLSNVRASLNLAEYGRSGVVETLIDAAKMADDAVGAAESIDPDWAVSLMTTQGIAQLELGRATNDRTHYENALSAFEQVAAKQDAQSDVLAWARAQNNIAVAQAGLAGLNEGSDFLEQAAKTYRSIADRMEQAGYEEQWAFYTRNLASALRSIGEQARDSATIREAIREFEKVSEFEADKPQTIETLGTLTQMAGAWGALGTVESDPEAFEKASATIGEAAEVYEQWSVPTAEIDAMRQQADLIWRAGDVGNDPEKVVQASNMYSDAKNRAQETGLDLAYAELTILQASSTLAAIAQGAIVEGPAPSTLAQELESFLSSLPNEATTPAWVSIQENLAELRAQIDEG